jgi:hypothetical protein
VAHQIPPLHGGGVRSYGTRGYAGALPIREAGSRATGHMAMLEPSLAGRQGPALQGSWRCVGACPAPCLDFKVVCRGTQSVGHRQIVSQLISQLHKLYT